MGHRPGRLRVGGVGGVTSELATLTEFAKSWGAVVESVPHTEFVKLEDRPDFSDCPFDLFIGVLHREKRVVWSQDRVPHWTTLLHELGHVLACREAPDVCQEFAFLGWEFAVAQHLGLSIPAWLEGNAYYGVRSGVELESLDIDEIDELLEDRLTEARRLGLLVGDTPISIRDTLP